MLSVRAARRLVGVNDRQWLYAFSAYSQPFGHTSVRSVERAVISAKKGVSVWGAARSSPVPRRVKESHFVVARACRKRRLWLKREGILN